MAKRGIKFLEFSNIYLNEQHFSDEVEEIIVGSDQVWNPTWLSDKEFEYFLLNPYVGIKKISYAASIGVKTLDKNINNL